jgi:hypothetical protein
VFSGFWAARNLPVASMLLTIVSASVLSRRWTPYPNARSRLVSFAARVDQMQTQLHAHLWPLVFIAITFAVCLHQGRLLGRPVMNAHFNEQRFPVHAVDFLARTGNHEPIFSLDTAGGYLIYRLYPERKVFIDDRHDFYGEEYLKQYLKVIHVFSDRERVLDEWHVNLAILPTDSKISQTIRINPNWRTAYSDPTATIFARK